MNEKDIFFSKVFEISSESFEVLDYAYYDNQMYVLLGNKKKDKVLLKRIHLTEKKEKNIEIQYFDHIEVNKTGIYLNYQSNHLEGLSATKKALKQKKLFNIGSRDLIDFRSLMYFDPVLTRFDLNIFDDSVSNNAKFNFKIDFDKRQLLYNTYLLPCKINGKYQVWLSYAKDTMVNNKFSGISIQVGELGYFYLPDKQALWDRRTGKVVYHIGDLNAALEKSLYLWNVNSKLAKIYRN
jgi:hypothetical protein